MLGTYSDDWVTLAMALVAGLAPLGQDQLVIMEVITQSAGSTYGSSYTYGSVEMLVYFRFPQRFHRITRDGRAMSREHLGMIKIRSLPADDGWGIVFILQQPVTG